MKYKNYLRVSRTCFDREFIVGVQFFDDDTLDYKTLRDDVILFLNVAIEFFNTELLKDDNYYAQTLKDAALLLYPGREFFIEIGDDKDSWVQVCPPEVTNVTN